MKEPVALPESAGRGGSPWSLAAWGGQLAGAWPSILLCAGAALGGCLAAYGIGKATGLSLIDLTRDPMRTDFLLLAAAIACLAVSLRMDKALPYRAADGSVNQGAVFLEDCFKFAGIVFWLGYVARTARSEALA